MAAAHGDGRSLVPFGDDETWLGLRRLGRLLGATSKTGGGGAVPQATILLFSATLPDASIVLPPPDARKAVRYYSPAPNTNLIGILSLTRPSLLPRRYVGNETVRAYIYKQDFRLTVALIIVSRSDHPLFIPPLTVTAINIHSLYSRSHTASYHCRALSSHPRLDTAYIHYTSSTTTLTDVDRHTLPLVGTAVKISRKEKKGKILA